jgi:hypothetical protein
MGHDPDIISDYAPQNFSLKMRPAFPYVLLQFKAPFNVGNIGFNTTAPFLQVSLHVLTGDMIFEAADDFIEHHIDHSSASGMVKIVTT